MAVSCLLAEDKRGNAQRASGKKIKRDEEGFQTVSRETKRDVPLLYHPVAVLLANRSGDGAKRKGFHVKQRCGFV